MSVPIPTIVTCSQWGARKPKAPPIACGRPKLIVIHHTDSSSAYTRLDRIKQKSAAIAFARSIQNFHMDTRKWSDTGQSFTVMRSGIILQGRWGTLTAIEHGKMVISAHCPGQNDQPGIEHEHVIGQSFTPAQKRATIALMAWIASKCAIRPTELFGHKAFYNTDCPDNLNEDIPSLRAGVAALLSHHGYEKPIAKRQFFVTRKARRELRA